MITDYLISGDDSAVLPDDRLRSMLTRDELLRSTGFPGNRARLGAREDGHVQGHGQNLYRVLEQSHELHEGE